MTPIPRQHFDFYYWIDELIAAGRKIEVAKYTPDYTVRIKRAWQNQPMTKLVAMVIRRRNEAMQKPMN